MKNSFYVIEHKLPGRSPWYLATKGGRWVMASRRTDAIRFYQERDAKQVLSLDHTPTSKKEACRVVLCSPLDGHDGGDLSNLAALGSPVLYKP